MSKETWYSVKRDLVQCQKRPNSVERDLIQCGKRPIFNLVSKWTLYYFSSRYGQEGATDLERMVYDLGHDVMNLAAMSASPRALN